MSTFSKRVQILLSPEQFSRLQAIARSEGESVGSLVRNAIEDVYLRRAECERLDAVWQLGAMSLPVSDWEQMEDHGIQRIVTADRHIDGLPGITRIDPAEWTTRGAPK